jgi:hypothetical protein
MKKFASILLVIAVLLFSIVTVSAAAPSPTVEQNLVPVIPQDYIFKTSAGNFIKADEIKCEPVKDISDYAQIPNLLYVFNISSNYKLAEGEYIEFPIVTEMRNVKLFARIEETGNALWVQEVIPGNWMLHITEYGTVIVTYKEVVSV